MFVVSLTLPSVHQNLIFRYLQNRSRIQVWLYEQVNMRIEGCIIVSPLPPVFPPLFYLAKAPETISWLLMPSCVVEASTSLPLSGL
ncbi:unnamed protein product [Oncorhynchus mykiss]|uniref:Uncharacterized protein n=1 Tax=Oncorhynchus mykiss TaxID=8022 RepID=A0A060ZF79_ONCMY|nr:unnamed protein product [Oncorhynchus mykiss]